MAASKMIPEDSIKKLAECAVCLEVLFKPKMLDCQHSFCCNCLAALSGQNLLREKVLRTDLAGLIICCPVCKQDHGPVESIGSLRTNFMINGILDVLEAHSSGIPERNDLLCSCHKPAEFICVGSEDTYYCRKHFLDLKYFCTKCHKAVCLDGFLIDHKDHEVTPIDNAKDFAADYVGQFKEVAKTIIEDHNNVAETVERVLDNLESNEKKFFDDFFAQKRKIEGLISAIFHRAEKYYRSIVQTTRASFLQISTSASFSFDPQGLEQDLRNSNCIAITDYLRVFHSEILKLEEAMEQVKAYLARSKDFKRYNQGMVLKIDEKTMFNKVIGLFENMSLEPYQTGKFVPTKYFKYDAYMNGEYNFNHECAQVSNEASNSIKSDVGFKARKTYDRDFLLKFKFWNIRPNFEKSFTCTLTEPHFRAGVRLGRPRVSMARRRS
eukprot:gene6728-12290_t